MPTMHKARSMMILRQLLYDLHHELLSDMPAGQATVLLKDLSLHRV